MSLNVYDKLPEGFLEASPTELYKVLPGPSLIHLEGKRQPPLFLSILLHGNEVTSLFGVQRLLKKYQEQGLPRSIDLFVGNTQAARTEERHLPDQRDFNRVWSGGDSPEHKIADEVLEIMRKRSPFACVDIHNNTGRNPHYACINTLDLSSLNLASLFGRTVIYFVEPHEVLSRAFSRFCPSITVECGLSGEASGIDHLENFLDSLVHLSELPQVSREKLGLEVFHSSLRVKVAAEVDVRNELKFIDNIDKLNFIPLKEQTLLGHSTFKGNHPLEVHNELGENCTDQYIQIDDGNLFVIKEVTPGMFTKNVEVMQQDCLGYFMERIDLLNDPRTN